MSESNEPKQFPPSEKKLRDLKKKGQFPKTQFSDPVSHLMFFVISFVFFIYYLFDKYDQILEISFHADVYAITSTVADQILYICALLLLGKIIFNALLWVLVNKSVVNSQGLKMKLDQLNPATGFKNAFGIQALSKSLRLVIELVALLFLMKYSYDIFKDRIEFLAVINNAECSIQTFLDLTIYSAFFFIVYGIVIGAIDYMVERFQFRNKHKMTLTEMKNEAKESEGSPEIKSSRRSAMQEIMNQPITKGRKPNFAIGNPNHIMVPICYDRTIDTAPVVLQISLDFKAVEYRKSLEKNEIPIIEDAVLARKIYAKANAGLCFVPKEFYRDIALIISSLKKKKKNQAAHEKE